MGACGLLGQMSVQELMLQLIPDETSRAVYSQLIQASRGVDAPP